MMPLTLAAIGEENLIKKLVEKPRERNIWRTLVL